MSADCLDCHVENKDIPGGSENAQFLQDLGCRGSNCDLANAYLENTTGEILMTTGGIPGTAAPTGPRTKTPRPSPPPTVRLKFKRPVYGFTAFSKISEKPSKVNKKMPQPKFFINFQRTALLRMTSQLQVNSACSQPTTSSTNRSKR